MVFDSLLADNCALTEEDWVRGFADSLFFRVCFFVRASIGVICVCNEVIQPNNGANSTHGGRVLDGTGLQCVVRESYSIVVLDRSSRRVNAFSACPSHVENCPRMCEHRSSAYVFFFDRLSGYPLTSG